MSEGRIRDSVAKKLEQEAKHRRREAQADLLLMLVEMDLEEQMDLAERND